jgi:hypothetical protein
MKGAHQFPKTQQMFDDQPSRSRRTVDACSWPVRCERSERYLGGWGL